jgi:hypothetical protein
LDGAVRPLQARVPVRVLAGAFAGFELHGGQPLPGEGADRSDGQQRSGQGQEGADGGWLDRDDDRTLFEVMLETIGALRATLAAFPPVPAGPAARQASAAGAEQPLPSAPGG